MDKKIDRKTSIDKRFCQVQPVELLFGSRINPSVPLVVWHLVVKFISDPFIFTKVIVKT